jgi:25S rRNA (uracil2634-N3)-methyltransferase
MSLTDQNVGGSVAVRKKKRLQKRAAAQSTHAKVEKINETEEHQNANNKEETTETKEIPQTGQIVSRCRTRHYKRDHNILILGEGNFSFARSLTELLGSAVNMTATSLDSAEECASKYDDAFPHIEVIQQRGGTVLQGIDATKVHTYKSLQNQAFDRIIFNFPHAGRGIKDQERNIAVNRELLSGFFLSASNKLNKDGEIHVTLKTGLPYSKWNVVACASMHDLVLKETRVFDPRDYPGYAHRRTSGFKRGLSLDNNKELTKQNCRTFVFIQKCDATALRPGKQNKRANKEARGASKKKKQEKGKKRKVASKRFLANKRNKKR